jgi:heat-inducible transcriptional repressor
VAALLDDRKLDVLRAIVEDFVSTNEPVGSKSLVEKHRLGVSPATIRNDMATLEEEGYIAQPHTSAGRVPTDKGYRLFVDRLSAVKALSGAERRAIETFLEGAVDLDDIVHRTVRLLAQLTRQVAVVQYPSLSRSTVRHVELVPITANRLMLVLITDTGRVEQRVLDVATSLSEDNVSVLRTAVNSRVAGQRFTEVPGLLTDLHEAVHPDLRPTATAVIAVLLETLVERREERAALAGTANLALSPLDFPMTLRPVLEALEEQVVLIRLLGETADPGEVTVRIGEENPFEALYPASVVSAGYTAGESAVASLGILGPMRMDYPGAMGAVRAVARYVGQILSEQ